MSSNSFIKRVEPSPQPTQQSSQRKTITYGKIFDSSRKIREIEDKLTNEAIRLLRRNPDESHNRDRDWNALVKLSNELKAVYMQFEKTHNRDRAMVPKLFDNLMIRVGNNLVSANIELKVFKDAIDAAQRQRACGPKVPLQSETNLITIPKR